MPSTSPSECAWSVDTTSTRRPALRITHRGRGRQRRLAYPALADEEADPGLAVGAAGHWIHSASTRFFRSFNAVSVSLRSALRLSRPIIGMTRSTESS